MGKAALRAPSTQIQDGARRAMPAHCRGVPPPYSFGQMEIAEHLLVATCSRQPHLRDPDHYSDSL